MLSKEEAQKIAAVANVLRPDWSIAQVMGVLGKEDIRVRRTYRDTAIAMAALACDATTRQPTRLLESGPWWEVTAPAKPTVSYPEVIPGNCILCGIRRGDHRGTDHEYENPLDRGPGVGPTDEQRAALEAARIEAEKKLAAAREAEPAREVRDPAEVIASHLTEENA